MTYDLVIKNGSLVTASETFRADIGIQDGRIVAHGEYLSGKDEIDATGKLVMPGGIEAHCHIAQESATGGMTVLSRGKRVVDGGKLVAAPGHGKFVARAPSDLGNQPGHKAIELDPALNFGARIAP